MTTDTLRAAAQKLVALRQASGLECPISDVSDVYDPNEAAAWDKLNAALAAPVQEPVAYRRVVHRSSGAPYWSYTEGPLHGLDCQPLYAAPQAAPAAPAVPAVPHQWTETEAVNAAHAAGFAGTCWTMGPYELVHLLNMLAARPQVGQAGQGERG